MNELESLKHAWTRLREIVNAKDATRWANFYHPDAVIYLADVPFAVEDLAGRVSCGTGFFGGHEHIDLNAISIGCRIIGTTGVMWGHSSLARKPVDGPLVTEFNRYTIIWEKSTGEWRPIEAHFSEIPSRTL